MNDIIAKLNSILGTNEDNDFTQYEWDKAQQEEFEDYLYNKLVDDSAFRNEFLRIRTTNKKLLKRAVSEFSWNYGPKDKIALSSES